MAKTYPEKYGITIEALLKIEKNQGIIINLRPIEGNSFISGVLIKKTVLPLFVWMKIVILWT